MAWKATGSPTVRRQRGLWVVRVDGIDTETGQHRPRQLGTYKSQRAAKAALVSAAAHGSTGGSKMTVGKLVDDWVASRSHVGEATRAQYEWAAGHIRRGVGSIRLDQLDREDVSRWLESLAAGGAYSKRSITIFRTVLKAAVADAFASGEVRRDAVSRVPLPRKVAGKRTADAVQRAWTEEELTRFLTVTDEHRWGGPTRLAALYGLRRSELLGLRWSRLDLRKRTLTMDQALVSVQGKPVWTEGKNARSRRTISLDPHTVKALSDHRRLQLQERLAAGAAWEDHDLVVASKVGRPVTPENFSDTFDRLVKKAGVPRLTTHGLRHTAATHMVRSAKDLGEVRAAADILGHSPEMLMRTYSHALPDAVKSITARIGDRGARAPLPGRSL